MRRPPFACALLLLGLGLVAGPSARESPAAPASGGGTRLVAHRGLLRHAPENTLANYAACLELGLGFETDLQRTRDGHLVCIHDDTVERTTNGRGRVTEMTLAELRRLDAGSWFDVSFAGQRVPTLDEVLELVRRRGRPDTLVAMDFKGDDAGIERDMVRAAKRHRVLDRIVSIGRAIQLPEVRRRLRAADRTAQVAHLAGEAAALPAVLADPGSDWAYLRFIPSREQVEAVHRAGKKVFIAGPTVSAAQPENWRLARARRVDALLTDEPLEARQLWRQEVPGQR